MTIILDIIGGDRTKTKCQSQLSIKIKMQNKKTQTGVIAKEIDLNIDLFLKEHDITVPYTVRPPSGV